MKGKRPHATSGHKTPSDTADAVETQQPECAGSPTNSLTIYVVVAIVSNLKAHSPACKRSKVSTTGVNPTLNVMHTTNNGAAPAGAEMNTRKQYLTRSWVDVTSNATSLAKQKLKGCIISLSSSDTTPPSSTF
ncbi:hypothetical protein D5086_029404 [Populus alba]|uniref:Uncharacterized protein n=1 Tax=Populus alba TaxID=43335 RepID=A0ACC4ATE9_POPAL